MERYSYLESIKDDIKDYLEENGIILSSFEDVDRLYDDLWTNDSVTGNGSGSYTCNAYIAEEYICHNLDLLAEACEEFGCDMGEAIKRGAEYCDVTIRCYLIGNAINAIIAEKDGE